MNPQALKIYNILLDGNWHCPQEWGYADGHCKRITDINKFLAPKGQKIASAVCDCGRHTSKILKRKIVPLEANISRGGVVVAQRSHNPFYAGANPAPATKYCCGGAMRNQEHSKDCPVCEKQVEKIKGQSALFN